jgi:5'(3')-deoxyribonucleotidase
MNIGIDFDGVINTNNAAAMAIIENSIARKLGYHSRKQSARNSQDRYNFTDQDYATYQTLRHEYINSRHFFADMQMMPGADSAIKKLNDMSHRTYLVTARGCDSNGNFDANVRQYIYQTLKRWKLLNYGLLLDEQYSFFNPTTKQTDKVTQCKNMNIILLVDDDERNVQKVRQVDLSAIHFGVEVQNWQELLKQF